MSDLLDGTVFLVSPDARSADELRNLVDCVGVDVQAFASIEDFLKHGDPDRAACLLLDLRHEDARAPGPAEPQRAQQVTLPVLCVTGSRPDSRGAGAPPPGQPAGAPAELNELVRQVLEVAAASKRAQIARGEITRRLLALTPRERQVMQRVVQGASNKMIAYELGVSPRTVEIHRAHLMEKTGAQSLSELVRMAFAVGAVGTPEDFEDSEVED